MGGAPYDPHRGDNNVGEVRNIIAYESKEGPPNHNQELNDLWGGMDAQRAFLFGPLYRCREDEYEVPKPPEQSDESVNIEGAPVPKLPKQSDESVNIKDIIGGAPVPKIKPRDDNLEGESPL
jgi:hypothetical protein